MIYWRGTLVLILYIEDVRLTSHAVIEEDSKQAILIGLKVLQYLTWLLYIHDNTLELAMIALKSTFFSAVLRQLLIPDLFFFWIKMKSGVLTISEVRCLSDNGICIWHCMKIRIWRINITLRNESVPQLLGLAQSIQRKKR